MAHTRTQGANARAHSWDDQEEQEYAQRTGSWLPLDVLAGEEMYAGTPQLQAMPQPRRTVFAPTRRHPQAPPPPQAPQRQPQVRPHPQTQPQEQARSSGEALSKAQARTLAMLAGGLLTALALYVIVSAAVEWTQVKMDDLQYGRPRTSQMDAYVGHGEAEGVPSHFIAMNLNRRVTIMELPGSDSAKATTIVGPYLFGKGEDLTPVQMDVQDVDGDGKADLIVSVKSEQLLYLNDGASFRLATPEEQSAIQKALAARNSSQLSTGDPATGAEVGK